MNPDPNLPPASGSSSGDALLWLSRRCFLSDAGFAVGCVERVWVTYSPVRPSVAHMVKLREIRAANKVSFPGATVILTIIEAAALHMPDSALQKEAAAVAADFPVAGAATVIKGAVVSPLPSG